MTVYVLLHDGVATAFSSLASARAYPFEACGAPADAPQWREYHHRGRRLWVLPRVGAVIHETELLS